MGGRKEVRSLLLPPCPSILLMCITLCCFTRPAGALVLPQCAQINTTLPTGNITLNASCTDIAFVNVTVQNSTEVNVSIAAVMATSPTAALITVSMSSVALLAGAVLIIDSRGYGGAVVGANVSLVIESLSATNGAVVFIGAFPPGTSILIRNVNMTSDNLGIAPILPSLDALSLGWGKMLLLVNFSIVGNSSMFLVNASISVIVSMISLPMLVAGILTVANGSTFALRGCTMSSVSSSTSSSVLDIHSSMIISNNSAIVFTACNLTSNQGYAFFAGGSVSLPDHGSLFFTACNISSKLGYPFYINGPVGLSTSSSMDFASCIIMSRGLNNFVIYGALTVANNCTISFAGCEFAVSVSTGAYVAFAANSAVTVSANSRMLFTSCNMTASAGNAILLASVVTVSGSSSISFTACTIVSLSGTYVTVLMHAGLNLSGNSSMHISSCVVTAPGGSASYSGPGGGTNSIGLYRGVTLLSNSSLVVTLCAVTAAGGNALYFAWLFLDGGSRWVAVGTTFRNAISAYPPIEIGPAGLVMGNSSSVLLRQNNMSSAGNTTCVQTTLSINSTGKVSVMENNCTSIGSVWAGATSGGGLLYQRCNRLNGSLFAGLGFPAAFVTASECGSCTASACYVPSAIVNRTVCRVNAVTKAASCQCSPSGMTDLCLPTSWTATHTESSSATLSLSSQEMPPTTSVTSSQAASATPSDSPSASPSGTSSGTVPRTSSGTYSTTGSSTLSVTSTDTASGTLSGTFTGTTSGTSANTRSNTFSGTSTRTLTSLSATGTAASPTHSHGTRSRSLSESSSRLSPSETSSNSSVSSTFSDSVSCGQASVVSNETALQLVSSSSDDSQLYFSGTSLPVASIAMSTGLMVVVRAAPGVSISRAGNVTGTVGVVWTALLHNTSGAFVNVTGVMNSEAAGLLTLAEASRFSLTFDVEASGRCVFPDHRERLVFNWTLEPVPPPSALFAAATATFRASTVASSVLGSPMAVMTMTGMISILSLEACLYSDVDPLDSSVSPLGLAMGEEAGQYYRGGAGVALLLYAAFVVAGNIGAQLLHRVKGVELTAAFTKVHFPSVGMVAVGLFGQGLASCGMSLIRLDNSAGDVLLGTAALLVCSALVVRVFHLTTGARLECELVSQQEEGQDDDDPMKRAPEFVQRFIRNASWTLHYEDTTTTSFKRRHMMLIDDLLLPWWTAVELSSCLVQGAILGIRNNSLAMCRGQQWVLTAHTLLMAVAASYYRPCGAYFTNVFLIQSKVAAFVISLLVLLNTLTLDDIYSSAAELVTSVSALFASCQTLLTIFMMLVGRMPALERLRQRLMDQIARRLGTKGNRRRHFRPAACGGAVLQQPFLLLTGADEKDEATVASGGRAEAHQQLLSSQRAADSRRLGLLAVVLGDTISHMLRQHGDVTRLGIMSNEQRRENLRRLLMVATAQSLLRGQQQQEGSSQDYL